MFTVLTVLNVLSMLTTMLLAVATFVAANRGGRPVARQVLYRVLPVIAVTTFVGGVASVAEHDPLDAGAAFMASGACLITWGMMIVKDFGHSE